MMADTPEEQFQAFVESLGTLSPEKLTKLYLKTRETRQKAQRAFDLQDAQFKAIIETCQNFLLKKADEQGVKGFKTDLGTTFTSESLKVSIADQQAFFDFVKESGDLDFFEKRVSSTHVKEYMDSHEGVAPPGLNLFTAREMRVRKASEK